MVLSDHSTSQNSSYFWREGKGLLQKLYFLTWVVTV